MIRKYFDFFVAAVFIAVSAGVMHAQNSAGLQNSVIIFIHGDGDYLYHSKDGKALSADEVVLQKSLKAAAQLNNSDVFIFHQKPKTNSFLFFANDNLAIYHYRNGTLLENVSMKRSGTGLSDETAYYKSHSSPAGTTIVVYYGHEIPLSNGSGYNNSYPGNQFSIPVFSAALEKLSPGKKLDLLVLSTCFNGTPEVIKQLSGKADYIVASPDDLHLSYMNPLNLRKLNFYRSYNFEDFVVDFAGSSFRELKKTTETAAVISAYKTEDLSQLFLSKADEIDNPAEADNPAAEICDCEEKEKFIPSEASKGVIVFYNPPAFGKSKYKFEHSGWGCKKSGEYGSVPDMGFNVVTGKEP